MKKKTLKFLLCICSMVAMALPVSNVSAQTVTTIGGGAASAPYSGYVDGYTLTQAKFRQPYGLAMDPGGNYLFVADYSNNAVRYISNLGNTNTSITSTFSNSFAPAVTIGISHPVSVILDSFTNLYVLNQGNGTNGTVLKFNAVTNGHPSFLMTNASHLTNATAMAMDGLTNLYITVGSNTVLRITPSNTISIVGVVTNRGTRLQGIAVMDNGELALSDAGTNSGIWLMNPDTSTPSNNVTKLAGFNGAGYGKNTNNLSEDAAYAFFDQPGNLAKAGNGILVVADNNNNRVRLLNTISNTVTLFYGVNSNYWGNPKTSTDLWPGWLDGSSGALAGYAESRLPYGVVVAPDGSVFVAEDYYHVLRHITKTGLTAPKPGYPPLFNNPAGIALNSDGNNLYIADQANNAVRLLNLDDNSTTTYLTAADGISNPASVLVDTNDNLYILNQSTGTNGNILVFDAWGYFDHTNATGLNQPTAFTIDSTGNLFVTEQGGAVKVVYPSGAINTIVTVATNASVSLQGIAIMDNGLIAVSDAGNHVIWTINPITKALARLSGQFTNSGVKIGTSATAQLNQPHQLARSGTNIVVADYGNNRLALVSTNGTLTTNSLNSSKALLWFGNANDPSTNSGAIPMVGPSGVAVSSAGTVYASEPYNQDIRGLTTNITAATTAPNVILPYFITPTGVSFDPRDKNLYIADPGADAVQLLNLNSNTTSTFLTSLAGISRPASVWVDTNGLYPFVYVLDQNDGTNGSILKFDTQTNAYGTVVSGLNLPTAFTEDGYGNFFVAEQAGNVRVFGTGISNVLATITNAHVSLQGIALFDDGTIAVSDAGNHVVWTVNAITKNVSLLTGIIGSNGATLGSNGVAKLYQPHQLARAGGNQLVIADTGNNRLVTVRRDGAITNVLNSTDATVYFGQTGDPVASSNPKFVPMVQPVGVAVGSSGVFASETYYEDIRDLTASSVTYPTSNPGVPLPFYSGPAGIALNSTNTILFITDPVNNTVNALNLTNNTTSVFLYTNSGLNQPVDVTLDSSDNLYVLNQGDGSNGSILKFDKFRNLLSTNATGLALPTAMYRTIYGDIYVAELAGTILKISSGVTTTMAVVTNAGVQLQGITLLADNSIVVSDSYNDVLWKINTGTTNAVVFTGKTNAPGTTYGALGNAQLNHPMRLALASGDLVVIADNGNNRVVVADDVGTIDSGRTINPTNATLWFGNASDPVSSSSPYFVSMYSPVGLAISSSGTVYDSETTYRDIRGNLTTGITPPAGPPAAPAAPEIGYVTFVDDSNGNSVSQLVPVTTSVTFHNAAIIDILPATNGLSTYYTSGAANVPTPSSTNGTTATDYSDGTLQASTPDLGVTRLPSLTIRAVSVDSYQQSSALAQATFNFLVGNPSISGNNAAQFSVSNITTGAQMYYTVDGTDPTNDVSGTSVGPVLSGATINLVITTNITFKIKGYRTGFQPSATVATTFSATNFTANTISFGFASGEASSDFVASPGQTFYAPVTLSTLSGTIMYSLQFNLTVTNGGVNPGPAVVSGAYGFTSMLVKPIPNVSPVVYEPIPPAMFVDGSTYNLTPVKLDGSTNFESLLTYNTGLNLLGVGWLERLTKTNLYDTTSQDLIKYSIAHDTLFQESSNKVVVGGYAFQVPGSATNGQTYQIQIGRPSATSDGIGANGSDVYIAAPTNGATAGGSPINAFKYVTVGQRKYLAGSVYPFRWFNAGDFGSSNIVNADVMQVFQSAVYSLNTPPAGSDFFDAMDSCGGTYVDLGHGYLEFNSYISGSSALTPLFDVNDTSINQIAFGDGVLDVCDVYVTYRRSLDPSLTWFERYWNNGVRVADTGITNVASHVVSKAAVAKATVRSNVTSTNTVSPQVNFAAGDIQGLPGSQVTIPITATVFGSYPLRVLMLNLTVEPLDGSPALTNNVQFTQTADLGTPVTTDSDDNGNYSAVWLDNSIAGLTGTNNIGMLTVTIPAGASTNAAYAVHFDHASASPNGLASFPKQMFTGLITLASRTNSSLGDGIPDAWRLRWFGTLNTNANCLILSNASAAGDGVSNWKKYVAGVDPNTTNDFPSVHAMTSIPSGYTSAIHWPTVSGKQYVVESASSLFSGSWTTNATITGTGADMEYKDTTAGAAKFYRVQILQ